MTKIITAEERIARAEKIKEYKEAKREYELVKSGGNVPPQGAMRNVGTQQNNAERVAEQSTKYDNKSVNWGVETAATIADIGGDILLGATKGLEGVYDFFAGLVGGIGGWFNKDFQNDVKKHIEYDLAGAGNDYFEKGFTKYSALKGNKAGEIIDGIFTGIGQMLPAVALSFLPGGAAIAATTMGVGAAGNATEDSFNDGASYGEGLLYGGTQGALEGGMEVMTGGVGRLAKMTGKVGVKSVGKEIGKEMLSEAFEEGTQELVTPLTRGIYKGAEAFEEYKDPQLYKNALQSAVVGGAVGGIMSGGSYGVRSVANRKTGGNKALFVQNGLAEISDLSKKENAEWSKGELDSVKYEKIHTEMNDNYKEISRQLMSEKPEIRANSIEKFNLNNTFNKDGTIKDGVLVSQEEMKSRFNTEPQNIYAGQPQVLAEGQPQLQMLQDGQPQNMANVDALANTSEQDQNMAYEGQNALGGQTVMANGVVQNSKLASLGNTATMQTIGNQHAMPTKPTQSHNKEAYNPSLRNTELLLAPTSGKISKSGKAAKNTISAISPNTKMVITDIGEFNGNKFNAFVDNNSGIVYINNNANSADVMKAVAVHEITHTLEGTKQYEKLSKFVVESLPDFDIRVNKKIKEYANTNVQLKQGENAEILSIYEARTEVIADYMGELLSNEQSIRRLALKDKSLTIRIFEWIKNALAKLVGKGDSKSENYKFLRKAESLYAKAIQNAVGGISLAEIDKALSMYKEMAEAEESLNNNETEKIAESERFSIKTDEKNRQYVKADRKVIFGDSPKVWATQITSFINGVIRGGKDIKIKTVEGDVLTITENTAGKAAYRNEIKKADGNYRKLTDGEYKTKLNAEAHIDELSKISLAQKDENGKIAIKEDVNLKHIARGLAKDGWNYRSTYFMDFDGTMYKVRLSVAIDGTVASVYNVGKLKSIPQSPTANGVGVSDSKVKRNTSNISILNNSENVNEKEKNSNDLNNAKVNEVVKSEKQPMKEDKDRYSLKPFAEQVDDVLSGNQERNTDVYVMETPKILQDVGLNNLPMLMTARHIKKINLPKDNAMHQHGVSAEIIKKIPSMLEHPVMIMDSISDNPNNSIVIIGEEVVDNEPMLMAVRVDGHGIENKVVIDSNFITSAYGRHNFNDFIVNNLNANSFLFVDKKRSQALFSLVGVQFPERLNNLNFNTIIRKTKANVNSIEENNRYSLKTDSKIDYEGKELSGGKANELRANLEKSKVYSKKDSRRIIESVLREQLMLSEKYGVVDNKSKAQVIDMLWNGLNVASSGQKVAIARDIAKFITRSAVMESIYDEVDNQPYIDTIRILKDYLHSLDLDSIKSEIKSHFGNSSPYALWGKRKGKRGLAPDVAAIPIMESGFQIKSENSADIFFEIADAYSEAVQALKKKAKINFERSMSAEELSTVENQIVNEIVEGYASEGRSSKKAEIIKKYSSKMEAVKERSNAINHLFSSIDRMEGLVKYKGVGTQLADEVIRVVKLLKRMKTYRGNLSNKIREILEVYSQDIGGMKMYDALADLGSGVENPFSMIIEHIAYSKGDLTVQQLKDLDTIILDAIHNINNYKKVFFEGKRQETIPLAERAINEVKEVRKVCSEGLGAPLTRYDNWIKTPINRIRRLSSYDENSVMYGVTNELIEGNKRKAIFNKKRDDVFKEFFEKNKRYEKTLRFEMIQLSNGEKISKGQAMSLYCTAKSFGGRKHLFASKGGNDGVVKLSNEKYAATKRFSDAYSEGKELKLDKKTIDDIEKSFSKLDREALPLFEKLFNEVYKNAKLETDLALKGISNVIEGFYFPFAVCNDQKYKSLGDKQGMSDEFDVRNPSFNKERKLNAKDKLYIENIVDIADRYGQQISIYQAYAIPIRAFDKLYNEKINNTTIYGTSLKEEIAKVDSSFEKFINKLFADIQDIKSGENSGFDKFAGAALSATATAALGFNIKVYVTQMLSVVAAKGVGISYANLAKGAAIAVELKTDYEKAIEYCPILYTRFKDGSNMATGQLKQRQGILEGISWIKKVATSPIGAMDKFSCYVIWNACVEQTKNSKNYSNESHEHYTAAGNLLLKAITETQSNFDPLYRPDVLRSSSQLLKGVTMFTGEPLQQYNQIVSSVSKIRAAKYLQKNASGDSVKIERAKRLIKKANVQARHAVTGVVVNVILALLIEQFFRWFKDKEEVTAENLGKFVAEDFFENIFGMFPIVRDVYSMFQGYDSTNMAYSGLSNMTNGVKELWSIVDLLISKKPYDQSRVNEALRKSLLGVSQAFGIPFRNLETYIMGLIKKISPESGYRYDNFFGLKTNYSKDLKKSIANGDNKLSDTILEVMLEADSVGTKDKNTTRKMRELYEQGYNILPKSVPKSITYGAESVTLSNKQNARFKEVYEKANSTIDKLTKSNAFVEAEDSIQAESVKFAYEYYYNLAVEDLFDIELTSKNFLFAKAFDVAELAIAVSQIKSFEADVDKKGNNVQGSKKFKVQTYVNTLALTAAQKYMIMAYCGYANTKGREKVRAYINSLDVTKKQKEALFAMCGYSTAKTA